MSYRIIERPFGGSWRFRSGHVRVRLLFGIPGRLGRLFQRGLHALQQSFLGIDAVLAGNQVLAAGVDEADYRIVPGRLPECLKRLLILALGVVVDADGNEVLRQLQDVFVRERTAPEILAGPSPRHFLEED